MKKTLTLIGLSAMLTAFTCQAQFMLYSVPLETNTIGQCTLPDKTLVTTNATPELTKASMVRMLRSEYAQKIQALNKSVCDFANLTADKRPIATNENTADIISTLTHGEIQLSGATPERATRAYFSAIAETAVRAGPNVDDTINAYVTSITVLDTAIDQAK